MLKIGARVPGVGHQLLLPMGAALELRNHCISAARLLVHAPGKNQKSPGDKNGDAEKNGYANFQCALQRKCVAGHLFGDR